jgi:NAD(P)-dependent dehydrogenase (short-subunit alcohol dehydrogenase family)
MTVSADTSPPRIALVAGALGSAADAATLGRALATQFAQRGWDVALQRSPGAPRAAADALIAEVAARGRRAVVLDADLAREADAGAGRRAARRWAARRARCRHRARAPTTRTRPTARRWPARARNVAALALARALADATPDAARDDGAARVRDPRARSGTVSPGAAQFSHALMQAALNRATAALALSPRAEGAGRGAGARPAPQADDIAAAACYPASAPGVTGATLTVDGGEHLVPPDAGLNE